MALFYVCIVKKLFRKLFALSLITVIFTGCQTSQRALNDVLNIIQTKNLIKNIVPTSNQHLNKIIQMAVLHLAKEAVKEWGKNPKQSTTYEYVKYLNSYKSRASIDYSKRSITVETNLKHKSELQKAIVTTLLAPYNPTLSELYSANEPKVGDTPFLYEDVVDNNNKPIRWEWRANEYAKYLLKNRRKTKFVNKKEVQYVTFSMIPKKNAAIKYHNKYSKLVNTEAKKYNLSPALIMAIIETESNFNPYAISSVPAYGLMQIVPSTAGRDSWRYLHNQDKSPSKQYLFNTNNNIRMGSAYLYLLHNRYLKDVKHPLSRQYCAIAAYNTGASNVYRAFNGKKALALRMINQLKPKEVYQRLRQKLPYKETRRYIQKVITAKRNYT